jgi:FkbM family methyltransferase
MQTVLGDHLIGAPRNKIMMLHKYKAHKRFEANIIDTLPLNSSYLDIGSNFGDTVLTLAKYAQRINRSDIRFFAFEPNKIKCDYIKKINDLNNLNIKVIESCVGDVNGYSQVNSDRDELSGAVSYKTIIKEEEAIQNNDVVFRTIKLDDMEKELTPIGFMHIDVEGWEPKVLKGAWNILENKKNKMYMVVEYWSISDSKSRNFSDTPEEDILQEMNKHNYVRKPDLIDGQTNLVFTMNLP